MRRIFHQGIITLSLVFMAWLLADQWTQFKTLHLDFDPFLLSLSMLGLVGIFLLDAYGWHLILVSLGPSLPIYRAIRVWLLSSLARYIPGGVWPYLSRASMAKDEGVGLMECNLSLYLETIILMASSLVIGFPAILNSINITISPAFAFLVLLLFGLLMSPKVILLLRFVPGKVGETIGRAKLPAPSRLVGLLFYYVLLWILFGAVFVCFARAIYPLPYQQWVHVGSAIALAFFSGFIVFFSPGGIGIREAAIYLLLAPFLPQPACLAISIGSRIWIMLGELLAIGLVLILGGGWTKKNIRA